jgi:hypothetical protein
LFTPIPSLQGRAEISIWLFLIQACALGHGVLGPYKVAMGTRGTCTMLIAPEDLIMHLESPKRLDLFWVHYQIKTWKQMKR